MLTPLSCWRGGGGGADTHSARATSAVSSRNCFLRLVQTSLTVCWSRPTCQKPHRAWSLPSIRGSVARLRVVWDQEGRKHMFGVTTRKAPDQDLRSLMS